jgi:nicotinamidase-related amidase
MHLKENDISKLVICGMMTDVCVASTTRAAMDYGLKTLSLSMLLTKNKNLTEKYYSHR